MQPVTSDSRPAGRRRASPWWAPALCVVALASGGVEAGAAPAADSGAETEARAWGALVYAGSGDVQPLGQPSAQFDAIKPRLAKAFKTFAPSDFTLLAQHTQQIFKAYESWVVPSKELYLKVDSRGPAPGGGTRLGLQVWQGDKVLVKTDAVLTADRPLFIGGPRWRGGQLIFVIQLL